MRLREHPAVVSGKNDVLRIDPRQLQIDAGFNVRDLDAPSARSALDELKEQIRFEGVRVPLEVRLRGDDLIIVSGHRRHKVVMELIDEGAEILTVPAVAEPVTVSDADRVAGLVTMNAGLPLNELEKAEVVRRLLGYGWDRDKIRARLGFKTNQSIADLEKLLVLPEPVKEEVRAGTISATTARNVVQREGPERAAETIATAKESAREAGKSRVTPRTLNRPAPAPPARVPVESKTVTQILASTLADIAVMNDMGRARKVARTCLRLQGLPVPPEEDFEEASDEDRAELIGALSEMVTSYCDEERGGAPLPDEEQPGPIQRALAILAKMSEAHRG